jgi:acyl phosphate:glycerol-3-phosphate acyltransferase
MHALIPNYPILLLKLCPESLAVSTAAAPGARSVPLGGLSGGQLPAALRLMIPGWISAMVAYATRERGAMIDSLGGPGYWPFATCFLLAYLVGSIPFGLIVTRLGGAGDLRSIGSGNIGATNVLRTGRKGLAIATLILDVLKGALPAWLAGRYGPDMAVVAGLGTVLGHCFPVWLRFRGGKGVATALGVMLVLTPLVALLTVLLFVVVTAISRYVSLGSMLAAVAACGLAYYFGHVQAAELYLVLTLLIVAKHASNIRRLFAGTESKLGARG